MVSLVMSAPSALQCVSLPDNRPPGSWVWHNHTSQLASGKIITAQVCLRMRIHLSVCLSVCTCWQRAQISLLCIVTSVPITCLCRGPLKPKLAAMRSAWSSWTPSNISMTSCKKDRGRESNCETESEREQEAQTLGYNLTQDTCSH